MIPIDLNLRNRIPRELTPWSLGRFGPLINGIAIAWVAVITIVFVLPPNELVLWTMIAFTIALAISWRLSPRAVRER